MAWKRLAQAAGGARERVKEAGRTQPSGSYRAPSAPVLRQPTRSSILRTTARSVAAPSGNEARQALLPSSLPLTALHAPTVFLRPRARATDQLPAAPDRRAAAAAQDWWIRTTKLQHPECRPLRQTGLQRPACRGRQFLTPRPPPPAAALGFLRSSVFLSHRDVFRSCFSASCYKRHLVLSKVTQASMGLAFLVAC